MPLLFIKHGIVVIVTPLKKLFRKQFVEVLAENKMNAVSMTVLVLIDISNIQQRLVERATCAPTVC